jgi:hypothetical protein
MRRYLLIFSALFSLIAPAAQAANSTVSAMTAASAFAGTELLYIVQSAADRKGTPAQMATYVYSLMTGDCTVTASAITCTKINGNAVPSGAAANQLLVGTAANTFSLKTVPDCTDTGGNHINYTQSTNAFSCGTSAIVSSVTGGVGITVSPTTGAVVVSAPATRRDNTATTDTITSSDKGTVVTENNASSVAVAITTAGFVSTDYFTVKNLGAGLATYTPSAGNIDGASTITCAQKQSADLYFDGTNYKALANTCQLGALATVTPGANVATAAAVALSGAGGLTSTIASGTSALGTGAISSAACATVVTTSATNTATTDVVLASFNGDPTAVTGYIPATAGMLTIIAYPTANNVNFKVCNNTSSSITPGAITLNWRVVR